MNRVKVKFPDSPIKYEYQTHIRVGDLNYGNHLGNDRILLLAHDARQSYFNSLNQSEMKFLDCSLIMVDSICCYKSQGHWNNPIQINIQVDQVTPTGFTLFYRLINTESQVDIAHVQTTMLLFDYTNNRIKKLDDKAQLLNLF